MKLLLLNLSIAAAWLGISATQNGITFIIGLILGFTLISLLEGFFQNPSYSRRILGFLAYLYYFSKALIIANITMLTHILITPNNKIEPNLVEIDIQGLTDIEIIILTHSITLTPGTITIDILKPEGKLLIHAFDGHTKEQVEQSITQDLTRHILRFTR
jgi:multicomponent Na+:H+ antiporter subunit E